MVFDCHTHPLGHEGGKYTLEKLKPFVERGITEGLFGIGFTDHEWYEEEINYKVVESLQKNYPDFKILLGIEFDYVPGREKEIESILSKNPYDYSIGSVHEIDGWPFDYPTYKYQYENKEINYIYERYLALLEEAVSTGLFQLVGHLDLIKIFGYRYQGDLSTLAEPLLRKIKTQGMAVELNTNGLYKPVKEFYPSREILKDCLHNQIPVSLSSDAHEADQVGRDFSMGKELLKSLGYKKLAHFHEKKIVLTDF